MKDKLKNLPALFAPLVQALKAYGVFTYLVIVLVIYGFLVLRIGTFSSKSPAQSDIDAKLTVTRRPQVNEDVAQKLQALEENSSEVHTLFNQARKNPFQE